MSVPVGDRITVPRTLLALSAGAAIVGGEVLEGLCLLGVVAIWMVCWPDPHGTHEE